jgi:arsenite methyltransferase
VSEPASRDKWAEWVLARRHADDAEQKRRALEFLGPIRDRVLENARVRPGRVVLDVGAGDGLIAFGAMPLVEESGRVVFCDVSQDLLDHCRNAATELGVAERAEFARAAAEDLSPIPDGSVDVVTTRSVLIYVQDKDAALREFHRGSVPVGACRSSSRSTTPSPTTRTPSGGSKRARSGTSWRRSGCQRAGTPRTI